MKFYPYFSGDYCKGSEVAGGIMIRCMCSTDGCNSGRSLLPSLVSTLIAAILTVLLWKRP